MLEDRKTVCFFGKKRLGNRKILFLQKRIVLIKHSSGRCKRKRGDCVLRALLWYIRTDERTADQYSSGQKPYEDLFFLFVLCYPSHLSSGEACSLMVHSFSHGFHHNGWQDALQSTAQNLIKILTSDTNTAQSQAYRRRTETVAHIPSRVL